MIKKPLAALMMWVLLASTVSAQVARGVQNDYRFLIDATNRINEIFSTPQAEPEVVLQAVSAACSALNKLHESKVFREDLEAMQQLRSDAEPYLNEVQNELDLFLLNFLPQEARALEEAGLSKRSIHSILGSAGVFRKRLRDPIEPEEVLTYIDKLAYEVCGAEQLLRSQFEEKVEQARAELERATTQKALKRWAIGVGGVATMIADFYVPFPPVAYVSGVVGHEMLRYSIRGEQ